MSEIIKAILFGIVEGITEWLPVSSMNVRLNNSKKSAVLLQDSKIIHVSDCYNISFCSLILWYSGGYMYGMKEMVHMSRVDMWGNAAGGV